MSKTLILWLSDLHCGSPVALYPNEVLPLMNGPRGPSALQVALYKQWRFVLDYTAEARKDADRLVVVLLGDLVEGIHHQSQEIISAYLTDHQKIAETLLRELKEVTQYDSVYFVDGTPSHVAENEYQLSEIMKGELYAPGKSTWPLLRRKIYGHLIYAAHHGPAAGKGITRGNALRNRLKQIHYQNLLTNQPVPDLVVFADKHDHHAERVTTQDGRGIDGVILPSWKLLDGYMGKVDPFAFSNIGGMLSTCTERGITSEFLTIHIEQNPIGDL